MDGERKMITPPKVKVLLKDINKLKQDAVTKDDFQSIKHEISVIKQSSNDNV